MAYKINRRSLLSSNARIQVPWIKVTFVAKDYKYTFGVFTKETLSDAQSQGEGYLGKRYKIEYPNYVQSVEITKINGQVNQYKLVINYPVTHNDDPNFFEKIFSSVSKTRKIILTYGDATAPDYVYQEEEAIITTVQQTFNLESSCISYVVNAISSCVLQASASITKPTYNNAKPSEIIRQVFKEQGLDKIFTGMNARNWNNLIAQDDARVTIEAKSNISALDYITYLASCMYESSNPDTENPKQIYILTIHDNANDSLYEDYDDIVQGPYFTVKKVNYQMEKSDAYEIDVGINTSTIITNFSIENNANYAIYYDYQQQVNSNSYTMRLNNKGQWEAEYSPTLLSKNNQHKATAADKTWWTKVTQFPINANITIQGLLRPAHLLTYVRLNVIFPGGNYHISSGLYIITKQVDNIDERGYRTSLSMTKVGGALLEQDPNIIVSKSGRTVDLAKKNKVLEKKMLIEWPI